MTDRDFGREPEGAAPPRLPRSLEDMVTAALQRVADQGGFNLTPLYHGQSLWYLKRKWDAVIQRIQVCGVGDFPDTELRFVPDLYEIDQVRGVLKTLTEVPREAIALLPIRSLIMPAETKPGSLIEARAWDCIKSFDWLSKNQLTTTVRLR